MNGKRITGAVIVTVAAMAGAAAGAAAAGSPDPTAPTIGADWKIDLRTVGAVGGIVLPATWWLSRRLARFDGRLEAGDKRFEQMEEAINKLGAAIEALPCHAWDTCGPAKKKIINEPIGKRL